MSMIKAVIFDLGGTLQTEEYDDERKIAFARRLMKRLSVSGIHLPGSADDLSESLTANALEYKHHSEKTRREEPADVIWSSWYLRDYHIPKEKLAPFAEELSFLYDHDRAKYTPRPRLRETFEVLNKRGIKTGIISNIISRTALPQFVKDYGIEQYMSCLVMSSVTGIRKPDVAMFRIAEEKTGCTPDELCYVGDTISRDVIGTRNAGWALMIKIDEPRSYIRDAGLEHSGYKPDCTIRDLFDVTEIVENVNRKESA